MEPAEFILKIVIILSFCFGVLGMIVQSSQFDGIVQTQDSERTAIDLAHAAAAMPCLTEKVAGESRAGLLLESELDKYQGSYDACIVLSSEWSVTVSGGGKTWTMGKAITGSAPSRSLPVAIRLNDGTVVPGTLTAKARRFA